MRRGLTAWRPQKTFVEVELLRRMTWRQPCWWLPCQFAKEVEAACVGFRAVK